MIETVWAARRARGRLKPRGRVAIRAWLVGFVDPAKRDCVRHVGTLLRDDRSGAMHDGVPRGPLTAG